MAKRFLETSFFKSPFVRSLKAPLKALYCFIICDCDGSGIWNADFEIASVYVGLKIEKAEFEKAFQGKPEIIKKDFKKLILTNKTSVFYETCF
jgi:hypothetical protein